jgi:uncharacterized protein (DUF433 family)
MASSTIFRKRCFQPKFFSVVSTETWLTSLRAEKVKVRLLKWTHRVFHTFLSKSASKCKFLPPNFEYIVCAFYVGGSKACDRPNLYQYREGVPMPMKNWPLVDSNPAFLGGRPRIDGTRLSTEGVYEFCAGSDSDAHVKMFQDGRPYVTAGQIKQAIAFERKRRGI